MGVTAIKPEFAEDEKESDGADKTEPVLGDGDDEEGDVEAEFIPDEAKPLCTWSDDKDEHRRVFIFDKMADPDINGVTLVENMEAVCQWLKNGMVPRKRGAKVEVVKD